MSHPPARRTRPAPHDAHVGAWQAYRLQYVLDRCRIEPDDGCWIWRLALAGGSGLPQVQIPSGRRRVEGAHRVAWQALRGPIPPGLYLLRVCGNPRCCNPAHMRTATRKQVMAEAVARGSTSRGARHAAAVLQAVRARPATRLSIETVRAMRAMYAAQPNSAAVARHFGVHHAHAHRICTHRLWREPSPFAL